MRMHRPRLGWVRAALNKLAVRAAELPYLARRGEPGSPAWLIASEVRYGGLVSKVPRLRVSPADGRSPEMLARGGMIGGDRMLHHGYAKPYAEYLSRFERSAELTLVEVGILKGSGLAIWCDLFPRAHVVGLDIDLGHFEHHRAELVRRGAFSSNEPIVHVFDQLLDTPEDVRKLLGARKIDIVIDDGLHSEEAIRNTLRCLSPLLADEFVYFVEDFPVPLEQMEKIARPFHVAGFGELFVLTRYS